MSPISSSISPWVALVFAAGVNWFSQAGKLFGLTVRRKTFLKQVKPAGQKIVFADGEIGLITVFDAILTGRQSGQKLQCLYGNPIATNFFQN